MESIQFFTVKCSVSYRFLQILFIKLRYFSRRPNSLHFNTNYIYNLLCKRFKRHTDEIQWVNLDYSLIEKMYKAIREI